MIERIGQPAQITGSGVAIWIYHINTTCDLGIEWAPGAEPRMVYAFLFDSQHRETVWNHDFGLLSQLEMKKG